MNTLIYVPLKKGSLEGMLSIPKEPKGLVLFAHGSGSSRLSPRNTFVAKVLEQAGFATVLIDLLSKEEDVQYETRFDIALLTDRLKEIVSWLQSQPETKHFHIGLFGASTGAAAALEVAADLGSTIKAVVSRGGRPDLAMKSLPSVVSPTILIVGGNDWGVIELNESAFQALTCTKKFEIIPQATHLFEEPGCLEKVADVASDWFTKYLATQ